MKTIRDHRCTWFVVFAMFLPFQVAYGQTEEKQEDPNANNGRPFLDAADANFWMNNMIGYHQFTDQEIHWATGMELSEIQKMRNEMKKGGLLKTSFDKDSLKLLPYPGGRHPRIGFLDGAIRPADQFSWCYCGRHVVEHLPIHQIPQFLALLDLLLVYVAS